MKDYNTLQTSIDKVVGKIGLQKTIHLLESFISNTSIKQSGQEKSRMIAQYVIGIAIREYDFSQSAFLL